MKIAIIGCGTIANAAHIPSYLNNDEAEIKYFCDIIPERAQAAVEKYGCGTAVEDYHQVLSDPEVEVVLNLTRPYEHFEVTKQALLHGHRRPARREKRPLRKARRPHLCRGPGNAEGPARNRQGAEHRCGQPL